jgi:hypothetical protein
MKLLIVATFFSIAVSTLADLYEWEFPKAANCRGEGIRVYTSKIKLPAGGKISDSDWMYTCGRTPAFIRKTYFRRPTRCLLSYMGVDNSAEYDVMDPSCDVDYDWLFEKIGKVIGKDVRCWNAGVSDGCRVPWMDENSIIAKNYLNAACVAHDLCYTTPASFGITKEKCDQMMHNLGQNRCDEVNSPQCSLMMSIWYRVPISDYTNKNEGRKTSQAQYNEGQLQRTPCYLTATQRLSSLYPGSEIAIGGTRWSTNGAFFVVLRLNGNLEICSAAGKVVWSSNTGGLGIIKAKMQNDGNFVLRTGDDQPRWHTGTDHKPANHLLLTDDGRLVIYSMGHPTVQWSSISQGYLFPMSTNLRTESLNSTSIDDVGTMTMHEPLSDTSVDIVNIDRDPEGAPGQE